MGVKIIKGIIVLLLIIIALLLVTSCQKDDCKKEAWVERIVVSYVKEGEDPRVVKDGNLTYVANNLIIGSWGIGNACNSDDRFIDDHIIGDLNLKGDLIIYKGSLTIYGGNIIDNDFNTILECNESEIIFKTINELNLIKVCHYEKNIWIEQNALELHLSHGDVEESCPTLGDDDIILEDRESVMVDCSKELPFIYRDKNGVQWLYSEKPQKDHG